MNKKWRSKLLGAMLLAVAATVRALGLFLPRDREASSPEAVTAAVPVEQARRPPASTWPAAGAPRPIPARRSSRPPRRPKPH